MALKKQYTLHVDSKMDFTAAETLRARPWTIVALLVDIVSTKTALTSRSVQRIIYRGSHGLSLIFRRHTVVALALPLSKPDPSLKNSKNV